MRAVVMLAAMALAFAPVAEAAAAWRLVEQGRDVRVANGKMRVTPGENWNRSTSRPIKSGEVWTMDGANLNELYFVSSLESGETLFKDNDKKDRPLPAFPEGARITDIPFFYESSLRLSLGTPLFEMTAVEPAGLGGHDAVRFSYEFSFQGSALVYKGVAVGTIIDGELQLVSFTAPAIHYFDRDLRKVERIIASVTF